jgi:methionyl-tRNA synthetase
MEQQRKKFYLTTAIMYTNGLPHCGHAYEIISADVLARYHRVSGKDVFFLTGTDEHGQKVAESAAKENLKPIELCNQIVEKFKDMNNSFSVSNDLFIRTSQPNHYETCLWLWEQSKAQGDIYLGNYEGWYNTREEKFVTETEAQACNYIDVTSGKPLTKTSEPSYFFKLSKYQKKLIDHINNNPLFILPEERKVEMLTRLEEPLIDLSLSRTTFDWGIPIPSQGEKEKHVMYVWFDALTNYLTGIDYPNGANAKYWPPEVQIIGKDIAWFHTVIWPCMLMSVNIPLPKTVFSHGFVNDKEGKKMSKSLGNVVDPVEILKKYTQDNIRYYLMRDGVFGGDLSFNEESLISRHDAELQGTLGNLVRRALTLCKYSDMTIPDVEPYGEDEMFSLTTLKTKVEDHFNNFQIHSAIEVIFEQLRHVNDWLAKREPWKMKSDQLEEQKKIVRTVLEATYILGHFLSPVIPNSINAVFKDLNHPLVTLPEITGWHNLKPGTPVTVGELLFPRIGENRFEKHKANEAAKPEGSTPVAQQQKKTEGKPQQQAGGKGGKGKAEPVKELENDVRKLDLRVGRIISCKLHRNATAAHLYEEEIDVGEPKPRTVVSGLAKFIPIDQMEGKLVVLCCNMKPSAFKGVLSEAMVICANGNDHSVVELVEPPQGSIVGERIACEGFNTAQDPFPPQLNPKKKEFETYKPDLLTNADCVATYKGIPLSTSAGPCKSKSLANASLG